MSKASAPLPSAKRAMGLRTRAEKLASSYPPLLAEAERVAAIVAQGVHGRRRPGQGETFWQYRDYNPSDTAQSIDWRRSARGDHIYVRDNEWEASNTVWMWRDGSPGMDWSSKDNRQTKKDQASILLMALSSLLIRAGERCAVLGESEAPRAGRIGLERIALRLAQSDGPSENLDAAIPAFARLVIASDFLDGADIWRERVARLASRPAQGVLVHVIDPAERDFPYRGRVQMRLPGKARFDPLIIGRAERAREDYQNRFRAHCEQLANTARRLNWPLITHETDKPLTTTLTALFIAIGGEHL